ncbi:MAG: 30S ribosomal protein S1, partial [Leptolyngbyaceae cyanobacterium SM1_3_5]|nr:30S ribosomal protein S1 [Leptolyngbyaceae cyanobacterium SM1_3_5]
QISKNYVASLQSFFEVNQPIKAVIIDVDEPKRRISLSTKVLENYPGEMLEKMPEVMAEAAERMPKVAKDLDKQPES